MIDYLAVCTAQDNGTFWCYRTVFLDYYYFDGLITLRFAQPRTMGPSDATGLNFLIITILIDWLPCCLHSPGRWDPQMLTTGLHFLIITILIDWLPCRLHSRVGRFWVLRKFKLCVVPFSQIEFKKLKEWFWSKNQQELPILRSYFQKIPRGKILIIIFLQYNSSTSLLH